MNFTSFFSMIILSAVGFFQTPPDDFPTLVKTLDEDQLPILRVVAERNPTIQQKISGGFPWAKGKTVLYRVNENRVDPKVIGNLKKAVHQQVKDCGRYEGLKIQATKPASMVTKAMRILVVTFKFNGYLVTDSYRKDPLVIRFWICPNRATAQLLAWLRRGNELPPGSTLEERRKNFQSHDLGLFYFEDLNYGEIAYGIWPSYEISRSLPEEDPRSIQTRAFLRQNIIVEASTRSLTRPSSEAPWTSSGADVESFQEMDKILVALDHFIKTRKR